jgi:hypothetical protein
MFCAAVRACARRDNRVPQNWLTTALENGRRIGSLAQEVASHIQLLGIIRLFKEIGAHRFRLQGLQKRGGWLAERGGNISGEGAHVGSKNFFE